MKTLSYLIKDFCNLFYPSCCTCCHNELLGNEVLLCISCLLELPITRFHEYEDNPVRQRFWGRIKPQFACAFFYFHKDSKLQTLLHALKYKQQKEIGILLGQKIGYALLDNTWIKNIDIIIPIPLSKRKQKERGYNQSTLIAKGIFNVLQIPIDTQSVIRIKNTKSQTTMTITERMVNMKDAFEVVLPDNLMNKHILLVDDVLTTGATIESCAQEILRIPQTKISILTLAYAIE